MIVLDEHFCINIQIYSSFYDPKRGHTAHKSYKPIGYVHELQTKGIDDPISTVSFLVVFKFI